jgi:hypothetical protein
VHTTEDRRDIIDGMESDSFPSEDWFLFDTHSDTQFLLLVLSSHWSLIYR